MAVEILINQYTESRRHTPILAYENNKSMAIYEDTESLDLRAKNCYRSQFSQHEKEEKANFGTIWAICLTF